MGRLGDADALRSNLVHSTFLFDYAGSIFGELNNDLVAEQGADLLHWKPFGFRDEEVDNDGGDEAQAHV